MFIGKKSAIIGLLLAYTASGLAMDNKQLFWRQFARGAGKGLVFCSTLLVGTKSLLNPSFMQTTKVSNLNHYIALIGNPLFCVATHTGIWDGENEVKSKWYNFITPTSKIEGTGWMVGGAMVGLATWWINAKK